MPFEMFDRSQLNLLPLNQRVHDLDLSVMKPAVSDNGYSHPTVDILADRIQNAKAHQADVTLMLGGHVIRSGVAPSLIAMMESGHVTHFAMNGAAAIHDFELALIGATTESVAKYISEGQFGLWQETGLYNEAINQFAPQGYGFG